MNEIAKWRQDGEQRRLVADENGFQVEEYRDGWWVKIADATKGADV